MSVGAWARVSVQAAFNVARDSEEAVKRKAAKRIKPKLKAKIAKSFLQHRQQVQQSQAERTDKSANSIPTQCTHQPAVKSDKIHSTQDMQLIPALLLCLAMLIDLGNGLASILLSYDVLPELGKWTNIASALLCLMAMLISAIVLATKKYSSLLMGFVVTALCALATAVFATWTASWFIGA